MTSVFARTQKSTLVARLNEKPRFLILVAGPRQSGKTTLVSQALAEISRTSRYLSVDEPEPATGPPLSAAAADDRSDGRLRAAIPRNVRLDTHWLVRQWEQARIDAEASERGFVLAIDEIQKIANWSETVKGLWDADRRHDRNLHVILLGSAPLLMQRGLSESLAGRFETVRLTHWSFTEMAAAFGLDLESYIFYGGYPGAVPLIGETGRWREYILETLVTTNIERDILALQQIDRPILLKRLFELAAEHSGQILSYEKMIGRLQDPGNTTTLARYLDLLSKVGLIAGLEKYAGMVHLRKASNPKLNVLNTALMTAQSGLTFEQARADRGFWGRLVESAVGAHLWNTAELGLRVHYWREDDREVDFVLAQGPRLAAIEVKSGVRVRRSDLHGLKTFGERFGTDSLIVAGEGGVPLDEFLSTPAGHWL